VLFDRDRIAQVLINLIDNAFKFTDEGKIVVKTEKLNDHTVRISVKDNGIGIHPDDQPKLFQNFTQIRRKGARPVGGTGLGLAISKKIVAAHQGEMGVESSLGEGSLFYFTLPIEATYVAV
jgi:signal transduction histidine kinase